MLTFESFPWNQEKILVCNLTALNYVGGDNFPDL